MRAEVAMTDVLKRLFCRHAVQWSDQRQDYACCRCGALIHPRQLAGKAGFSLNSRL